MEIACFLDCEGPISKNDNAFEITSDFIPNGDRLFNIVSKYDDVLASVEKRDHYKAGNTLRLILPFLKAYDVTDQKMDRFSKQTVKLIENIRKTLNHLLIVAKTFIVSTSYEHYIKAICKVVNFPIDRTYSTKVKIDKYNLSKKDKLQIKQFSQEIAKMDLFEIPTDTNDLSDFSTKDRKVIYRLDEIFWRKMPQMSINKIFSDVNPIGGKEKAFAIKDGITRENILLKNVIYVGDSITDVEAFKLVKNNNGLTVAFNGNDYAIKNAEVAVISRTSLVIAIIVDVFSKFGKQKVMNLVKSWNWETLDKTGINQNLLRSFAKACNQQLPVAKIVSYNNIETIIKESVNFRKKIRGESIGKLG